jgi:predicted nucleic acid-binding protein
MYLLDTSVLARMRVSDAVAEVLRPFYVARAVATCSVIELNVLHSARDHAHYQRILRAQRQCVHLPLDEEVQARALAVQRQLSEISQHQGISAGDLLIAACAEVHGATILHYDKDFDIIADVTGQSSLWVVPPGSVP